LEDSSSSSSQPPVFKEARHFSGAGITQHG
jgi:hypothetical protein